MNNNKTTFQMPLTMEERSSLSKFLDKLDEEDVDYDSDLMGDSTLIRFLRARNLNIADTLKMFKEYLKWRDDEKIESINEFVYPEEIQVCKCYPHTYHNTDKTGRPLYIEKWANLDIPSMLEVTSPERFFRFYIKKAESVTTKILPACSKAANRFIGQTCLIVDIRDFGTKQFSKHLVGLMEKQFHADMNYYPELLGNAYVVSNSIFFKAIWVIVSGFLSENTKKKIKFLSDDFKERLLEIVDEDKLPAFLGGTCECKNGCLFTNLGPWNN